jgi:hypothetical protein
MFTMADYETSMHNIYINAGVHPVDKLKLSSAIALNKSRGGYNKVVMPNVSDRLVNAAGEPELAYQTQTFDGMHEYSDLDYQLIRFSMGAEYDLTPSVALTLDGDYADLSDKAGYIYGTESGSFSLIRSGVRINF